MSEIRTGMVTGRPWKEWHRFYGNWFLTQIYTFFHFSDTDRAEKQIELFINAYREADCDVELPKWQFTARVRLQRRQWYDAEQAIRNVTANSEAMQYAEMATGAQRILGDALLGQGRTANARTEYLRVMPFAFSGWKALDLEQTFIKKRLDKLDRGEEGPNVLDGEIL